MSSVVPRLHDREQDTVKRTEEIKEEQSKRIFWVIQTVFSLLLASSLIEYKACLLNPFSAQYYLTALGLMLVYLTVALSWIDYSFTTIVSPYDFRRGGFETVRFFIDLLIVFAYAYLLFSLDVLQKDKGANLSSLFFCLFLVFALYFLSGLLRILRYGPRASRLTLIGKFAGVFLLIAIVYRALFPRLLNNEIQNVVFIPLAGAAMVAYRLRRYKLTRRKTWIAVDVDGVLANQIQNLLPIIKRKHGVELKYEEVTKWDLPVGNSDIPQIIKEELRNKRYVLGMPPIAGAREALNALIRKYRTVIVTTRPSESDSWTKEWLEANKMPYDAYANTQEGNKQNIDIDYWLLIDDYVRNIEQYLEQSDGKAILFSQPWNKDRGHLQEYMDQGRLLVAEDWGEAQRKLDNIDNRE